MAEHNMFRDLFCHALDLHRREFSVRTSELFQAMIEIQEGYSKPENSDAKRKVLDYSDPALRCAYLHKYGGSHADLVHQILFKIHHHLPHLLPELLLRNEETNICCLGGGPGNDVIAMSSAISTIIPFPVQLYKAHFHFTIVDKMHAWAYTFETLLSAAESGFYGQLGDFLANRVSSEYRGADILTKVEVPMNAIQNADIVTMIKFVSAVESDEVPQMLQRVFDWLKPGAVVLFIDNDAGGFFEAVTLAATISSLEVAFGPLRHFLYENEAFKQKLYGISSLSRSKVSVVMWRKPAPFQPRSSEPLMGLPIPRNGLHRNGQWNFSRLPFPRNGQWNFSGLTRYRQQHFWTEFVWGNQQCF